MSFADSQNLPVQNSRSTGRSQSQLDVPPTAFGVLMLIVSEHTFSGHCPLVFLWRLHEQRKYGSESKDVYELVAVVFAFWTDQSVI